MSGIHSIILKWLVSYLTKRTQSVYIDDAKWDLLATRFNTWTEIIFIYIYIYK